MVKRIYSETIKKWAIGTGVTATTFASLLIIYLQFIGAIEITGHSGDSICSGTELDPCYAYINFTAKEDIFIYPMDYSPTGENTIFTFNPGVSGWEFQERVNNSWKNIDLNKTLNKNVAYAYVFRKGIDYELRIIGYKYNKTDNIKWSIFYENKTIVDPEWYSPLTRGVELEEDKDNEIEFINNGTYGTIKISDDMGTVGLYNLEENTDYCAAICSFVLSGNLNSSDYILRGITAYNLDKKTEKSNINFTYYVEKLVNYTTEEQTNIKETCKDVEYENKSTGRDCTYIYDSINVTKEVMDWVEYDIYSKKITGDFRIKVEGRKGVLEDVEWIAEAFGKEMTPWQRWNAVFKNNLRFWWEFNETGAATDAIDMVSGNTGTGTSIDTWGAGKIGGAVTLDGANDFFTLTDDAGFDNLTAQMTISAWIYPDSLAGDDGGIISQESAGQRKFYLWVENDNANFYYTDTIDHSFCGAADSHTADFKAVPDAQWSHIVVTYNADTDDVKMYLNNTLICDSNITIGNLGGSTTAPKIGEWTYNGAFNWKGKLDQLIVWDRALNETEVTALWNNSAGLTPEDVYGEDIEATPPTVTLNKPIASDKFLTTTIVFNATITKETNNLKNETIYVWNSTDDIFYTNITEQDSETDVEAIWSVTDFLSGTHKWGVYACAEGTTTECTWATNVTFNKLCYFIGTVNDSDDNPINAARVVILRAVTDTYITNSTTNSTGDWYANATLPGNYNLYAYESGNATRPGDIKTYVVCT